MECIKETIKTIFTILMIFVVSVIIGFFLMFVICGKVDEKSMETTQSMHDLNFEEIEESTGDRIYFEKNPDDIYVLYFENGNVFKDSGVLRFRAKNARKDGEDIIFEFENGGNIVWNPSTKMAMMYDDGRTKHTKMRELRNKKNDQF